MGLDGGEATREAEREALMRAIDRIMGDGGVRTKQPDDQSDIDRVPGTFTVLDLLKQKILKSLWGFLDVAGLRGTQVFERLEADLDTVLKEHSAATPVDAIRYLVEGHMELGRPLIQKLIDVYAARAATELRTGVIAEPVSYVIAALQMCLAITQAPPEQLMELADELMTKISAESPLRKRLFYLRGALFRSRIRPPTTLEDLIEASRSAEERGDIETALGLEMEIVRRKPTAIIGRYRCVDFLIQLGRLREAERFLYETERLIRDLVARDSNRMGGFWDAIEARMLQENPPPADIHASASLRMLTRWAEQARGQGDFVAAITFARTILERLPDDFSALDRLAKDYLGAEEFAEAISIRERMVELWPDNPVARRRLEAARNEWGRAEQNIPSQRDRFRRFLHSLLEKTAEWEFPEGRNDPYRKIPVAEFESLKMKFAKFEELFLRCNIFNADEFRQFWKIFGQVKEQILGGYINTMVIRNLLMRTGE